MIFIEPRNLPEVIARALADWQSGIDRLSSYEERVREGKRLFKTRNTAHNPVFSEVRRVLDAMCCGPRRCGYCEDSCADEVEHIRPKDIFPDSVFSWINYLYACGPCNGPKADKYAVFDADQITPINVSRSRSDPVVPPKVGDPVFVNPRAEDPLEYLFLDLRGTFYFVPAAKPDTRDHVRAQYTIDTLRLNSRDALVKARKNAYSAYRARLGEYVAIAKEGGDREQRAMCIAELKASPHTTVWREMQRQAPLHPQLTALFSEVPEALTW
jgi:uncharacterized protein (TIGR02646 family)